MLQHFRQLSAQFMLRVYKAQNNPGFDVNVNLKEEFTWLKQKKKKSAPGELKMTALPV